MCRVYNKHHRDAPADAVYIGRGSIWGNKFVIGEHGTRAEVIEKYCQWILQQPHLLARLWELKGKDLVCYCFPAACHGDVLLILANDYDLTQFVLR